LDTLEQIDHRRFRRGRPPGFAVVATTFAARCKRCQTLSPQDADRDAAHALAVADGWALADAGMMCPACAALPPDVPEVAALDAADLEALRADWLARGAPADDEPVTADERVPARASEHVDEQQPDHQAEEKQRHHRGEPPADDAAARALELAEDLGDDGDDDEAALEAEHHGEADARTVAQDAAPAGAGKPKRRRKRNA
jgi:hypothetical protein